ncbi:putative bifunctional diguanylate cyclase/phosphodiesterase [Arsukibacterium sp.]|uniref:putative bifunctional diguanylate cyclase/phosphodiesterase n=1 Tax=Arsukibacterium sp. TaxID=1977258 RepID=UPI002FD95F62
MFKSNKQHQLLRYYPLLGASLYLVFGWAWVAFSDGLLAWLVDDPQLLMRYQTYKGLFYIVLTAGMAWFLLQQQHLYARHLAASEKAFNQTFDHAAAGVAYVAPDGRLVRVNQAFCQLMGYSEQELAAMGLSQLTHPAEVMTDQQQWQQLVAGSSKRYSIEKRYLRKDGQQLWARLSVALADSEPVKVICVIQDISSLKHTQQQLQESELRFRTLLDNTPQISVQGYDEFGTTIYWNRASELIYGYSKEEALGQNLLQLIIPPAMHAGVKQAIYDMASSGEARPAEELSLRRKDGSIVEVYSAHAVVQLPDKRPQIYCIDLDLTERKQQQAELAFLAEYDPLTHLPNRHFFNQQLEHSLKVARRDQQGIAVLLLDLDHFKNVNDSLGHNSGDQLLQQVADRLRCCCRESDTLARLGGDEFGLLLERIPQAEDAARFAQKVLQQLETPFILAAGQELTIAASIGISLFPQHSDTVESLIQGADAALYKAKAEGRNTYSYFSDQLTEKARQRLTLEARLRQAIKLQQLCCYYQPQLDITSGQMIGAELLIRWLDPEVGLIPPDQFIPVAESCGLIHAIGHFVLQQACEQGQRWLNMGLPALRLAVNVSPQQFAKGDLQQQVLDLLQKTGYPPASLELEVTENALMADEDRVVESMQALRELGIRLAVDDFGTGYSSLAYLKRLPLDLLKIDRRFIEDLAVTSDDRQITKAIIDLAHTLKFEVLAEGVETQSQLAVLKQMQCDYYQGYYFSRPLPEAEFTALLQQHAKVVMP